jgi:hypothetical protein
VRTNLRRFEARDYLFRAALCLMGAEMPEPELDEDKEDDEEELGYAIIAASEEKYHNIVWKVCDERWRMGSPAQTRAFPSPSSPRCLRWTWC